MVCCQAGFGVAVAVGVSVGVEVGGMSVKVAVRVGLVVFKALIVATGAGEAQAHKRTSSRKKGDRRFIEKYLPFYPISLIAFCLMPSHYHMLQSTG